ncbi:MAG: gamma-glutamyl-gamma-aminobutyrate hydrolase family protein [Alphaproteobacteria bacterium]|nr:gamma-glutamyl-gamma-aminobutyrate hydrolase family protein [Alphaproteobacteria bacterium]
MRPLIGIIPDYKEGSSSGYSVRNYYALCANYVEAINAAGGSAILLTYDYDLIDFYLKTCDGLLIVGGHFDIHPKRYGVSEIHSTVKLNEVRESFEWEVGTRALAAGKPIFGICNGMQLINVLHGGSVIQHIPDTGRFMDHEQSHTAEFKDYKTAYHEVLIEKNSQLFGIIGEEKIKTNSSHHQAAKQVGKGLIVSARASDGVIEAVEKPNYPFCLGVQWHPEFNVSPADQKIFSFFVKAAGKD